MKTHTPEPWKVKTLDGELWVNPDRGENEYALIARVQNHSANSVGNARLIAAAPLMYTTLQAVADKLRENDDPRYWITLDNIDAALTAADGIAKAEGGES